MSSLDLCHDVIAEVRTQEVRSVEIDRPAEDLGQFVLRREESETRRVPIPNRKGRGDVFDDADRTARECPVRLSY